MLGGASGVFVWRGNKICERVVCLTCFLLLLLLFLTIEVALRMGENLVITRGRSALHVFYHVFGFSIFFLLFVSFSVGHVFLSFVPACPLEKASFTLGTPIRPLISSLAEGCTPHRIPVSRRDGSAAL